MDPVDARAGRSAPAEIGRSVPGARPRGPRHAPPDARPIEHGASDRRVRGLDGLRAWAVVAVIVYHVNPAWLPGGFVGVDVFFVVSGFLITTLLVREVADRGRVSLPAFWLRRARRLLPALAVVVTVSLVAARVVSGDLLVGVPRQVAGAATFLTNWVEVSAGSDYFAQREPQLFAPFWSLAIEEQFYLVWPLALVVLLVVLRRWRARSSLALGLALASAAWMLVLFRDPGDATRVYYGTDTHAFGLLLGAAAAFAWRAVAPGRGRAVVPPWAPPLALAALTGLAFALRPEGAWTFRGGLLVASLLAVVAVVGCAVGDPRFVRVLELPPVVWVGARSYGLYLWHWPVLLVVGAVVVAPVGSGRWWWGTVLAVALTVGAAAASYRWIETPVRRRGFRAVARDAAGALRGGRRAPRLVAATAVVAVAVAAIAVVAAPGRSSTEAAIEAGQRAIEAAARAGQASSSASAAAPSARASASLPASPASSASPAPAVRAPAPVVTAPAGRPVTGADVVAFGDSVLSAAAPAVLKAVPGIAIDAKPIRKWIDAPAVVQAAADAGRLRPVVVLAFGTNGGFQFSGSQDALAHVMSIIGPDRQVVFVNVVGVSYWVGAANAELVKLAADYPGARVLDWHSIVTPHPSWLHSDRTHPSMAGIGPYADMLEHALASMTID